MQTLQVQGAPNLYVCESGALKKMAVYIKQQNFSKGLIIHGEKSWQVAKNYVDSVSLHTEQVKYRGDCTKQEVERISQVAKKSQVDYIVGVGGGKIIDLAKATAHNIQLPYIVVPTLASNCAPWTPLSVFYDEEGAFTHYEMFPQNAFMVAVDPQIIIDSPKSYLRAGIGDTIAKWYEAAVLAEGLEHKPLAVDVSLHAARLCRDVLIQDGASAMEALANQAVTPAFVKVMETIIMAGGMVGGFGDRYGRIAGAHSIHNGLTVLSETHDILHGDKVAYGILVQLALEDRFDEIEKLLSYYEELQLPASLTDLNILTQLEVACAKVAKTATKQGESIHYMEPSSEKAVLIAMKELETFVLNKRSDYTGL